jgi:hypothetical protein
VGSSQQYRLPRPVTGIALLYFLKMSMACVFHVYENTGIPVGWFVGNTTMITALRIVITDSDRIMLQ